MVVHVTILTKLKYAFVCLYHFLFYRGSVRGYYPQRGIGNAGGGVGIYVYLLLYYR